MGTASEFHSPSASLVRPSPPSGKTGQTLQDSNFRSKVNLVWCLVFALHEWNIVLWVISCVIDFAHCFSIDHVCWKSSSSLNRAPQTKPCWPNMAILLIVCQFLQPEVVNLRKCCAFLVARCDLIVHHFILSVRALLDRDRGFCASVHHVLSMFHSQCALLPERI
jgi:hypothetical protein